MSVRFEAHTEPIPGYRLLHRLGAGGFGEVWKCEAPGGIHKAIKIIHGDLRSRDNDLVRYAEQELKALKRVKQVRHPYLLALDRYDIVEGRLMIVMELADCNLWDRFRQCREQGLPGIPRPELLTYMREIAEVLDLFNDEFQLQHLDIKPQNLFLLYNHIKVADFGQVKDLQNWVAQVTGGITPVYAAPETFDGIITRYCDQYSLACVYQELLTGVRPFDGASMNQLFVQHTSGLPNLEPSPPADRPALLRALAKRPEDRWPSVTQFIHALAGDMALPGLLSPTLTDVETPRDPQLVETNTTDSLIEVSIPESPSTTPGEDGGVPIFTPAPPELTGDGCLQPSLIIGLGQTGLQLLQRFRAELYRRYGSREATPIIRTLFIDTDPQTLAEAQMAREAEPPAALAAHEVIAARLQRAAHYLKPRCHGRSLIEGWFDQQLLYRLPRQPQTMGIRLFGRLAFCDHYRTIMNKIQAEIEAAVALEALQTTEASTGLERRTNRPRVYIVANLAGATGGGMFLDLAYATRHRLRRMGYETADIIGLLVVPDADAVVSSPQELGNCYAALTELNHYLRSDTVFTAHYDERSGVVKDHRPPFTHCFLVSSAADASTVVSFSAPSAAPSTAPHMVFPRQSLRSVSTPKNPSRRGRTVTDSVAVETSSGPAFLPAVDALCQRLRLDLFTPVGRLADDLRSARRTPASANNETTAAGFVSVFHSVTFAWPRYQVVAETTEILAQRLLQLWTAPDVHRYQQEIPALALARWQQLGLEPESLTTRLREVADRCCGEPLETYLARLTESLQPRGWFFRGPEPTQVALLVDTYTKFFGPPTFLTRRPLTALEEAFAQTTADWQRAFANDFQLLLRELLQELPSRWAGTEEFHRALLAIVDPLIDRYQKVIIDADSNATRTYECLTQYAYHQKGLRKPSSVELSEASRSYPRVRLDALVSRCLLQLYQHLREQLTSQLAQVSTARQRLAVLAETLSPPASVPQSSSRQLLPPGCETMAEVVSRWVESLTDDDLLAMNQRIQAAFTRESTDLLQVHLQPSSRGDDILRLVREQLRPYLQARLGEVALSPMIAQRFPTLPQAEEAMRQAYQEAEPAWLGTGPWANPELAIVSCPNNPTDQVLREMAIRVIPVSNVCLVTTPDELTIYREWPAVPLAALPQLGPAAAAAYEAVPTIHQCSLHSRLDVTCWQGVDDN
ncbi:MAG: tubulin-like doman-containing protein [Gemmataceae bacterium]|nr:protein kinase [Gemmata sp.]MDW8199241.1 tubulin-like doman-containing protein [Gemmataceae bacterium]